MPKYRGIVHRLRWEMLHVELEAPDIPSARADVEAALLDHGYESAEYDWDAQEVHAQRPDDVVTDTEASPAITIQELSS